MSETDAIFTPVYKGDRYLYHECSECLYQVHMREQFAPIIFYGENFKFCPNCGKSVVRFAEIPKFLEEFNFAIFEKLDSIYKEYKDKLDYYCRIILTQEELEEMIEKCKFAVTLDERNGGYYLNNAIRQVAEMSSKKWSHWEIKKLNARIQEYKEAQKK